MRPPRYTGTWASIWALSGIVGFALAGCVWAEPTASVCPPVIPYTEADNRQAADELDLPPEKPMLRQMIADYITTRDRLRTCQ